MQKRPMTMYNRPITMQKEAYDNVKQAYYNAKEAKTPCTIISWIYNEYTLLDACAHNEVVHLYIGTHTLYIWWCDIWHMMMWHMVVHLYARTHTLSVCVPVCLSVCLSVCLRACVPVCVCVCGWVGGCVCVSPQQHSVSYRTDIRTWKKTHIRTYRIEGNM